MKINYFLIGILVALLLAMMWPARAQERIHPTDTLPTRTLEAVTITGQGETHYLPDARGVNIYAGKKTNVITVNDGNANVAQNLARTVFAKIPGINLWDMDGSGSQMNIGTRGTDAHRSIEMNMRQNGYNTNSDLFGYPENHYTAPMQAVKEVQLVRGSAALQFGSQFGGMMNYVLKEGDRTKPFAIESEQTVGSFNLFNSFNAVGGTKGKVNYYAYYNNRHSDGWRPNSDYQYNAFHVNIKYSFNAKASLSLQYSENNTRLHIAGGLTDAQFQQNARQSNRTRNFFDPTIRIPALEFNYAWSPRTSLQITTHGMIGDRSSVQFINTANVKDTINTTLGSYNPRQVDRDFYHGFTTEARLLHSYTINAQWSGKLAGGIRFFRQETLRRQKGKGTTAADNDLSLVAPYGIDLQFNTVNEAIFAEHVFQWSDRFSVTPGFRYEVIHSDLTGTISNGTFPVSYKGERSFPLFGMGLQWQASSATQVYANVSQAYRPYLYANITPADQVGVVDPNLKDSKGYDIDLGYRGQLANVLDFDVNAFYLFYGDKIGKLTLPSGNATYQLTTNIGNSVAQGVEAYISVWLLRARERQTRHTDLRLFTSTAYTHARYTSGALSNGSDNISLSGNRVENTPDWIQRAGLELRHKNIGGTLQVNYVSDQYSDANNTAFSSTGLVGYIPAYTLLDLAVNWKLLTHYHLAAGINNLADVRYFSRRINMYPGPGILPGDGRSFYLTFGIKL
jgi:Fe(3+) dicitrate transport protein